MRARTALALALAAPIVAGTGLASAPARAGDREACFSAAEAAQKLRAQGHLRAAHDKLLVCAQTSCPAAVQGDCATWLSEVTAQVPSIVVQARDATGNDLTDVKVMVDGATVADHLDGRPIELDPGSHTLRLERDGSVPVDRTLLLVAGQKARVVEAQLVPPAAAPPAGAGKPTGETPSKPETEPPSSTSSGIPLSVWVLGGVAALGLVSTGVFWGWGRSDYSNLQSCSPSCDPSSVSSVRTKLIVGDVSLGVAVVALGVGTWLYLTRRHEAAPAASTQSAQVLVAPQPGGGVVGVGGRF